MFRELLSYCVTSIEVSGCYSLRLVTLPTETRLFVNFWAGNSLHSMCLATFPGRQCTPSELIPPISSFLALLDRDTQLLFASGFTQWFVWAVSRVIPQHKRVCHVLKFDEEDLEQMLLVPTVQILDRFDFRSTLDFLMVQLRSACNSSWLMSLPDLQKVSSQFLFKFICSLFSLFCSTFCMVSFLLSCF